MVKQLVAIFIVLLVGAFVLAHFLNESGHPHPPLPAMPKLPGLDCDVAKGSGHAPPPPGCVK